MGQTRSVEELAICGGTPVRKEFLVYGAPDIGAEEIQEVVECLRSGWLGTGPRAERFENDVVAYTGAGHALATNSCTAAMHLSLLAAGVGSGDEVITTSMTFGATVNVIEHVGAKPVLVDIAKDSFLIDPDAIEERITEKTRAIIPVHFAGYPCDMDRINEVAREHDLTVIEDAAHALGAKYDDRMIGEGSNFTCFSFYVTKNITAGEGGMVVTNDGEVIARMRCYGLHGMTRGAWQRYAHHGKLHYDIVYPGYKYNMPDLSASVALQQLKKLEGFIARRAHYAKMYFELLKDQEALVLPTSLCPTSPSVRCAWHLYPVIIRPEKLRCSRDEVMQALIKENIGAATHFRGVFEQPYYRDKYGFRGEAFPNAKFVSDHVFSIPLATKLNEQDIQDVVNGLNKVLSYYSN
jgi:dTDP-4-amino-4,6-dideoxygalactose transaminase